MHTPALMWYAMQSYSTVLLFRCTVLYYTRNFEPLNYGTQHILLLVHYSTHRTFHNSAWIRTNTSTRTAVSKPTSLRFKKMLASFQADGSLGVTAAAGMLHTVCGRLCVYRGKSWVDVLGIKIYNLIVR